MENLCDKIVVVKGFQDYTRDEVRGILKKVKLSPSLADVLFFRAYRGNLTSWGVMDDFSPGKIRIFEEYLPLIKAEIAEEREGPDGSRKYVVRYRDGKEVETVLLKIGLGKTLCISTQVGCPVGCPFCATGRMGFYRNLTAGEIVEQVRVVSQRIFPERISRLVFFGMGEPFINYREMRKALHILMDNAGANFSRRKIALSTVGIKPVLEKWTEEGPETGLAVSLHAVRPELRKRLIPFAGCYELDELLSLLRWYTNGRGKQRKVMIEYVLLRGVNDGQGDAKKLGQILQGIRGKVNVICYNPVEGALFIRPEWEEAVAFVEEIRRSGFPAYLRESRALEITGACGQLMRNYG